MDNLDVFKMFLDGGPENEFFEHLINLCFHKMAYEKRIKPLKKDNENAYLYRFILFGALSVVKAWIADEDRESPAEMNQILFKMLIPYMNA